MSHFTAASVLLLLSLPHGFAAPSPPSELRAFPFLDAKSPAVGDTPQAGEAGVPQTPPLQAPHLEDLTGDSLSQSSFFKSLSNSIPNEAGPQPFDASETVVPPLPRQKVQSAGNITTNSTNLISLLGTLTNIMGDFFEPLPGEKEPPLPVVDDDLEQFLDESKAQASARPFPLNNGTTNPVNRTMARTAARTAARTRARMRARTIRGRRAAGPQLAPYPIPAAVPTPVSPAITLTSLLQPFIDILTSLLSSLPIVGGVVPTVRVPDALRILAKRDIASLDPSFALGAMAPLLSVAKDLLHYVPLPAHATANKRRINSLLKGIKKRRLASMEPTVAVDLVQRILDVLLKLVGTLPVAGKAVESVPLDTVFNVASGLAKHDGKRDNIDPRVVLLLIQQILNTTTTMLKDIPLVGTIVSALPLNTLQLDKVPLPVIPLDPITGLLPLSEITSNLPLGGLPGIITRRQFPFPGLPFDFGTGLVQQLVGMALGLAQSAPVLSNVVANLPTEAVTNTTAGHKKRHLPGAQQFDIVTGVVQQLLGMAVGLAKHIPVAGDVVNQVPLDAATKIVDGITTRDVANGLPLDIVTGLVSQLLDVALGLTDSVPLAAGLSNATSPGTIAGVAGSLSHQKRQLPLGVPLGIIPGIVQQILGVALNLTQSLPIVGDLLKGIPLHTTTGLPGKTGKEKRQLPGDLSLPIFTGVIQQLLGLALGLTTSPTVVSGLTSAVPESNVTRRVGGLGQMKNRDAAALSTHLNALTPLLQTILGVEPTLAGGEVVSKLSGASVPNGLEKDKRDTDAFPIPLDALASLLQSILGITTTLTSALPTGSSTAPGALGKRDDPVLPLPLNGLTTLLQTILSLTESLPIVGDILSQIPLGTVPGVLTRREALTQEQQTLLNAAMAKHTELKNAIAKLQALQHSRISKRQFGSVDLGGLALFMSVAQNLLNKVSKVHPPALPIPIVDVINITKPVDPASLLSKILSPTSLLGKLSNGKLPSSNLPIGGLFTGGLPIGGLPTGGLPTSGLPTGSIPTSGLPTGGLPTGGLPIGGLPTGGLPIGGLPTGGLPTGGRPLGGLPTGVLPIGGLPLGGLPPGGLPVGGLPLGGLPPGGLPVGGLPIGGLPPGGLPIGGLPPGGLPIGGLPPGGLPPGGLPLGGLPIGGPPLGGFPLGGLPIPRGGSLAARQALGHRPLRNISRPIRNATAPVTAFANTTAEEATPVTEAIAPVIGMAEPAVESATPVVDLFEPVADAVAPILNATFSAAAPVIAVVTPLSSAIYPVLDNVTSVLDIDSPALPVATPLASAVDPVLDTVSSVLNIDSPALAVATPLPSAVDTVLDTVSPVLDIASSALAAATPLASVVDTVLAPVSPAVAIASPALAAATPVTDVVSTALPLSLIKSLLQLISTILGISVPASPIPLTRRDEPTEPTFASLTEAMTPDFSYHVVHDFITKWHTVGAELNDVDPMLVEGLMAVFNDPASKPLPTDAHYLGRYPEKVRTFVYEYYLFAQVLDDNGVPEPDKVDILKLLFDDSTPRSEMDKDARRGFKKSVLELSDKK